VRTRTSLAGLLAALALLAAAPAARAADPATVEPRTAALATGDSMMQVMERTLRRRLEAEGLPTVVDSRIGTGITRPRLLDWVRYARWQTGIVEPRVTIVFLGANDILPFLRPRRTIRCCGDAYVAAYAGRVRRMLDAWLQTSERVYWMTLPAPRNADLGRYFRAANRGVRRAAASDPRVTLVDLEHVFAPRGRFRQTMRWDGRQVRVRMFDGVHLARDGWPIAAEVVAAALRRDGFLPPVP
jgi:hypothetical protein